MKKIAFIYTFLVLAFSAQSQIKFYEGDFKTPQKDLTALIFTDKKGIGVTIPIDATFKKYDRVWVSFQYSFQDGYEGDKGNWKPGEWMSVSPSSEYKYHPKSPTFKDNHGGKRLMKYYLAENESFTDFASIFRGDWMRGRFDRYKFRLVVGGYFEDGTYTEWNDYSDSFDTRTKYKFSKLFLTSEDLIFDVDNEYLEEQANEKLNEEKEKYKNAMNSAANTMTSEDLYNPTMSYYRTDALKSIEYRLSEAAKYTHIDSSGFYAHADFENIKSRFFSIRGKYDIPFVPTRNHVLESYYIARKHYMSSADFKGLKLLEEKLLQIKADKKHKTLKEKLIDKTDAQEIIDIVMSH